ncbi:hypothetical protein EUX98_g5248 [Antrodiella citrinella]|uniref:Uncharacterized protein n=1 Tax=Antrodiella citrinella TaxID=2447956 RepID=A0A4S4MS11_9APHY|nr:hypothetical protein EUX98_g5248 [Antrodiella citrinella]
MSTGLLPPRTRLGDTGGESEKFRMRRMRIRQMEHEQMVEDMAAVRMIQQLHNSSILAPSAVKTEFTDLDGMSWQPHPASRRASAKRSRAPSLSQRVSPRPTDTRRAHNRTSRPLPKSTSLTLTLPLPDDDDIDLGVLVTSATFCALPSPPLTSQFSPSTPSPTPTARAFLPLSQRGRLHAQPGERERTKKNSGRARGFALRDVQAQREQAARDLQNGVVALDTDGVDINETIRPSSSNRPVPPAPGVAAFTHPHGRRRVGSRSSYTHTHAEARPIYILRQLLEDGIEHNDMDAVQGYEEEEEEEEYQDDPPQTQPPQTHYTLQARAARAAALASASSSPHPHPLPHTRRTRTPTTQHVVLPLKIQRELTVRPSYSRKHSAEEADASLRGLRNRRERILEELEGLWDE